QASWQASPKRPDPIATLIAVNQGRQARLLPFKWWKMADSAFGFFRGAAPLMALDLAGLPTTGLRVQLCGDAHVDNLGAYEAPDGAIIFDLNDFDESMPGPWEWDVKRLATSIILAGDEAHASKGDRFEAAKSFVRSYRESIGRFSQTNALDLAKWRVRR